MYHMLLVIDYASTEIRPEPQQPGLLACQLQPRVRVQQPRLLLRLETQARVQAQERQRGRG